MGKRFGTFDPTAGKPVHQPRDDAKEERDAFYCSRRWRRLRARFLRENPLCCECLAKGVLTPSIIPHHVIERLVDPSKAYDWDNLKPYCNECHSRLHKSKGGQGEG